jgi:hypothetical protein
MNLRIYGGELYQLTDYRTCLHQRFYSGGTVDRDAWLFSQNQCVCHGDVKSARGKMQSISTRMTDRIMRLCLNDDNTVCRFYNQGRIATPLVALQPRSRSNPAGCITAILTFNDAYGIIISEIVPVNR